MAAADGLPFSKFTVSFGAEYDVPMEACYAGEDAAERLGAFAKDRCGGTVVVVSDENTRAAGGEPVLKALKDAGKTIVEKQFDAKPVDATDTLGDKVADVHPAADGYVAIGSGTLCDLAKHAGTKRDKPVFLFPTAASMNGYTSSIVALKVNGLKRTTPCNPAAGVFADPRVVATAPQRMTAAGVADFLSKASASSDWRAASYLRDEWFSDKARVFVRDVQEELLEATPAIGEAEPDAVGLVLEALLLSGFSMAIAGSSSPASGGEHLISHYLDMKHSLYGKANDLHGIQVGVATVHCLGLWEQVLALDPSAVDAEALSKAQPTPEDAEALIREDWDGIAGEVLAQWREKERDAGYVKTEIERVVSGLEELRNLIRPDFLNARTVRRAIEESGGPVVIEDTHASTGEYYNALQRARFIRNRFTILDLAAELGLA